MIQLPEAAETRFWDQLYAYEEAQNMPYITTVERAGVEKGLQQGEAAVLQRLLERKFGAEAATPYQERIEKADTDTLLAWSDQVLTAETPETVFKSNRD